METDFLDFCTSDAHRDKNVHPPQPMRATKSGLQHTNLSKINIEDYGKPSKNKTKLLIDMIASDQHS